MYWWVVIRPPSFYLEATLRNEPGHGTTKSVSEQEFAVTQKVSKMLPHLSTQQTMHIKKRLEELGVENEKDLELITEEDLVEDKLMTKVSARKLVKNWKSSSASSGLYDFLLLMVKFKLLN